jgi:hypothetical protein
VFGKQDTDAINLSDIAAGKGGFVINGELVKPPVPATMSDKLMASVSCLPNTTYDLPAFDLSFGLVL